MNSPSGFDDGWSELARELGIEEPATAPPPPAPAAPTLFEEPEDDEADREDEDAETETVSGEESENDTDGENESESGEPGDPTKKKRRRRRRRRKGPGEETEIGAAPAAEAPTLPKTHPTGPAASRRVPAPVEAETEADENDPGTYSEEESVSVDATRELIANWDVPSWETIVTTMLHRPGR